MHALHKITLIAFHLSCIFRLNSTVQKTPSSARQLARSLQLLMRAYNVELPERMPFSTPPGIEDTVSVSILSQFHPIMLESFTPRMITGDGNCMYRTISLGLY